MNLHLSIDDKFYNPFMHNQKKYAPDTENEYYIIKKGKTLINTPQDVNVKIHSIAEIKKVLKELDANKYQQVIFHSLPGSFRKHLLHHISGAIKITWILYGYEYYHRRDVIRDYLGPATLSYYESWQNPNFFRLKFQKILDQLQNEPGLYKNDLQRINRFAHWNKEEYELIKDEYQLDQMEHIPFSIGIKTHELVPDYHHRYLLLGHSGALTVNHLDGIEAMDKKFIDSFDRILIPFSYGGNKVYETTVRKALVEKLGEKVLFLNQFMERTSYFNLLSRVKIALMPQLRGMGGGNILFCLKNNIPLVFWRDSVMYRYYIERGFHVYAIDGIDTFLIKLTSEQIQNNHTKLNTNFGKDTIKDQYQKLLNI